MTHWPGEQVGSGDSGGTANVWGATVIPPNAKSEAPPRAWLEPFATCSCLSVAHAVALWDGALLEVAKLQVRLCGATAMGKKKRM